MRAAQGRRCGRSADGALVLGQRGAHRARSRRRPASRPEKEYEHGGVSPQECIVPRFIVTAGSATTTTGGPEITSVKWLGLALPNRSDGRREGRKGRPPRAPRQTPRRASPKRRKRRPVPARCRSSCLTRSMNGERAYLVVRHSRREDPCPARSKRGEEPMSELDDSGHDSPPKCSRAISCGRTLPSSSAASTPCQRTSASSFSGDTARRPIPTRSPRAWLSSSVQ